MDFARKQLEKYGWSAGKGLGKNENGIAEALKPKLKRSVTGVGHDPASDFTEHWWNDLYNKAAKNLEVEEVNGKTSIIKQKDPSDFEITNNAWNIKKKKIGDTSEQLYANNFVKKSILCNGVSKAENTTECDSEAEEVKKSFIMTDEELYTACEGRTAHKGARHGLKALGKLARIEQQEQILLNEAKYIGYSHTKTLKKKKFKGNNAQIVENNNQKDNVDIRPVKTKKFGHPHNNKNIEDSEKFIESMENGDCLRKTKITSCIKEDNILTSKKKKTKRKETVDFITNNSCDQINLSKLKKKKKMKDNANNNDESNVEIPIVYNDLNTDSISKHKTKKKKRT